MFKKTLLAAGLTAMASQAMAVEMPKGEVSLGLTEFASQEGIELGLKLDVYKGFFAEASYADMEDDFELAEFGIGYEHSVSKDVRVVSQLSYMDYEIGAFEDDALVVKVGFEADILDGVELRVGAERFDWDKQDVEDTDVYFGMGVKLTKDITVAVDHRKALDQTSVNVSWAF
jgi:hypothetical protein